MASIAEQRRKGRALRARDSAGGVDLAGHALFVAALAYLYFECVGGITRYIFPMVGLTLLNYIPAAIAIPAVMYDWIDRSTDRKYAIGIWLCLAAIASAAVMAILLSLAPLAVGVGLYAWLPFFVGLALAQRRELDRIVPHLAIIFGLATAGVILNWFVHMPWSDATYEVMGKQMAASRNWEQHGITRLAGFSRASFVAASEILVGFIALEFRLRSLGTKALAYALGLVAIILTTSKSPAATMIVLPFVYLIVGRFSETGPARRRLVAAAILAATLFFVFAGPLLAVNYGSLIYPNGVGTGRMYSSLADRMLNTWPRALDIIDWRNPVHWLVGQGVGSIGAAQMFTDTDMNPGDNLLVFLFVSFGALSFVFGVLIFRGGMVALAEGARGRRDFLMIFAMLGIGAMANVIEGVLTCFILGIACGRVRSRVSRPARPPRETPAAA